MTLHPLITRLLDGEVTLADLPPELRAEGERALRLIGLTDRAAVAFSPRLEHRVMSAARQRAAAPRPSPWRWLAAPREVRLRVRPWLWGPALAAVAVVAVLAGRLRAPVTEVAGEPGSAQVRLVFYSPDARAVAVAGSFNDWSPVTAPLTRAAGGMWTIILALPPGQHQYVFVVNGRSWVPDPSAPAVDDGFGRRNSVLAVARPGAVL